jgi:hypothetical protein
MKRVLLSVFAIALFAITTQAQDSRTTTTSGGTTFGLKAGINFQNVYGDDELGNKLDGSLGLKWTAGVNAEIPVAKDFYFQPGLSIGTKGAKFKDGANEARLNLYYLDIPMNLLYKPLVGNGHVLFGFGPYVGFGIGGKVIVENGGNDIESDVEYRNEVSIADQATSTTFFKRMDAGANILAGYEFNNRLSFQLNTQLGLMNVIPDEEGNTNSKEKMKHIGFGVSLGYRFGK